MVSVAMTLGACTSENKVKPRGDDSSVGRDASEKREITVSVAASLKESMQELGASFEATTGTHVLFNFAGSNELARQIIASPKADIFLSAAENWMDTVSAHGGVMEGTRHDILSNSLVVIANSGAAWKMDDPCAMASITFKNLSIGDPEAVPAGKYARTWLTSVQCGGTSLWDMVKDRMAPAPDVRAALGQVVASPDVIGIVYKTDQLAFKEKTRVLYEVKDGPPIRYVVAQVNGSPNPSDGKKFLDYLRSPDAEKIFENHGFTWIGDAGGSATP